MPPPATNLQRTSTPDRYRHPAAQHPTGLDLFSILSSRFTQILNSSLSNTPVPHLSINVMQPASENSLMGEYEESYLGHSQLSQSDGASCRVFFESPRDNGGFIQPYSTIIQGIPASVQQMTNVVPPGLHAANHQGSIGQHPAVHHVAIPNQAIGAQAPMGFHASSIGQLTGGPPAQGMHIGPMGHQQSALSSNAAGHVMTMPASQVAPAHPSLTGQTSTVNPTRALSLAPMPGEAEDEGRTILIDYIVFIRSAQNQSSGSSKPTTSTKEWDRVVPRAETVFKTDIARWDWRSLQAKILSIIEGPRDPIRNEGPGKLLRKHFEALDESGVLKWQCVLNSHRTYGHKGNYFVT
ncbi:uncharacterized protein PGTG_01406 [Puccinia graminis f. sp. tritici CRL 75-36-700-3]|uniref:Uncharacterized protein n=1 Tax=Puccinia graminis f. sp. tritici (strain CRL 75-36-700-3 / race SCCL) TaxID=418459 RepID=E3JRY8_PUCGT|nr:uncharacterized protein PGTG_01406 [Puccinia graminis f. sp. tritici CRL 75-36-700-3]EFP74813.1 hypothetical protein PGTG_01406 [Puccinia graminis f. sp. tritici CRL 75-36-700-3]